MKTFICAGHTFDHLTDRCIALVPGTLNTICNKRWIEIYDVDQSCVGKPGYAHQGNLTPHEFDQIQAEKIRRESRY